MLDILSRWNRWGRATLASCTPRDAVAERTRNPQKVFAVDPGLRNAVCFTLTPDLGRMAETLVHAALQRQPQDGLFCWRGKQEVDLVVRRGENIVQLVQVVDELGRDAAVRPLWQFLLHPAG